jgi:MFS family permease
LPIGQVLVITTTTQALTTLGALALAAVAPKAAADLAISPALIGYQVAVVYLGAMLSAPIGGGLVRRFGAMRTSQLALWLVAAGCALSALGTLASLAGGAFVMGLGYGGTNPAASHLLSRSPIARNMNLIFSIKQSGVPIGGVLTGMVVPPPYAGAELAGCPRHLRSLADWRRRRSTPAGRCGGWPPRPPCSDSAQWAGTACS